MPKFIEVKNYSSNLLEMINVSDIIKFEADFHEENQTILHIRDSKNSYFQIDEAYKHFKARLQGLLESKSGLKDLNWLKKILKLAWIKFFI